ncbi:MAG: DUF2974 domain-containing protein [Eggerthellaceae bacterium]|nr:DUF2974 domain-containing protein [Eggerthellaceae bacterium]
MSNIFDYLVWRGDLGIDAAPINEVDLAILSALVYIEFEDVASSNLTGKTIAQLSERFGEAAKVTEVLDFDKSVNRLWSLLGSSPRFAAAKMRRFVSLTEDNEIDEYDKQFCAATFSFASRDGEVAVVTFRGTDSTMIGWRENFTMAYEDTVPAQLEATAYINNALQRFERVHICGHSKGGNLSLYAAATAKAKLRDRIISITNFDGPGLNDAMLATPGWAAVKERVRTLVPPSSVVGMLFGTGEPRNVVQADGSGFLQHDLFMWHVEGPAFVPATEMTSSSAIFDRAIDEYIATTSVEERKNFVYGLFKIVDAAGVRTTEDMVPLMAKSLPGIIVGSGKPKGESFYTEGEATALKDFWGCLKRSGATELSEGLSELARPLLDRLKGDSEE